MMHMKSITIKLSLAMIICMIISVTLVGVIYMRNTIKLNDADSNKIIRLVCDDSAKSLDAQLVAIERSVDLIAQHSTFSIHDDNLSFAERIGMLEKISRSTAEYTDEAYSFYFHCNPDKYSSDMDFYYVRNLNTGEFKKGKTYNPYKYVEETGINADWYFASANAKKPCWLHPYTLGSGSDDELVIASYTVPIFSSDGELFGVLGMDYTFENLGEELSEISLYNTGYAFLVREDGSVILHPEIPFGNFMREFDKNLDDVMSVVKKDGSSKALFHYKFKGEDKQLAFSALRNGTYLMVTAPTKEINAVVDKMSKEGQILFAVILISSVMLVYCIIYKFIRPLQLLSYASQQIIKGNMQVELTYNADDEIGELTKNFRKMTQYLQRHISEINNLAHTDAMTGLKNKASYQIATSILQERMEQGFSEFAVVVFDINNLKFLNDALGHTAGDNLIKNAGHIISKAFTHSPVFRIGGDEFVAILENDDLRYFNECTEKLERMTKELNENLSPAERLSIAYGMVRFEPGRDENYRDVFIRADREMYRKKTEMKTHESADSNK